MKAIIVFILVTLSIFVDGCSRGEVENITGIRVYEKDITFKNCAHILRDCRDVCREHAENYKSNLRDCLDNCREKKYICEHSKDDVCLYNCVREFGVNSISTKVCQNKCIK